eukprot:11162873-Ditylum_brightwellii.AAC.1
MICRAQPRQVGDNDGGGEKASEPLGEGAGRFDVIVNVDNDNDGGGGGVDLVEMIYKRSILRLQTTINR